MYVYQTKCNKCNALTQIHQFEKILVLSAGPSWRTRGLLAAANLTGLDLQILKQPPIHPDLVNAFQALGDESTQHPALARGSRTSISSNTSGNLISTLP